MKGVLEGASSLNEHSRVISESFVSSAGAHESVVGIYAHAGCRQTKENGDGEAVKYNLLQFNLFVWRMTILKPTFLHNDDGDKEGTHLVTY